MSTRHNKRCNHSAAFKAMPNRWQGMVKTQLTDITEKEILEVLET